MNPLVDQSLATEALSQAEPLTPELGAGRLDLYRALSYLVERPQKARGTKR